jgi:three-Cys-motif partner protein
MSKKALRLDEIGYWSEVKLDIVKKYAMAYSTIMAKQSSIKRHIYIDAFAGAGQHISKATRDFVPGSPLNALRITPPFKELHLIDLDGEKATELQKLRTDDKRVTVHPGDCNEVLLRDVFPRCQYADYHRALCLLDPYGLNVNWEVLQTAGKMKSIEVFYNFMIMDANMNVFWRDRSKVAPAQIARMKAVWGDDSWPSAAYQKTRDLFGDVEEKATNRDIAVAFRDRLKNVAGFKYVPDPMPMRNSKGAVVYYLFFASQNKTGESIVQDIFNAYRNKGIP